MNQRIRELALQAGAVNVWEWASDDVLDTKNMDAKKFAELIVQECAKFLEENSGYDNSNNAWHPEPEDMLKHFGVEE